MNPPVVHFLVCLVPSHTFDQVLMVPQTCAIIPGESE